MGGGGGSGYTDGSVEVGGGGSISELFRVHRWFCLISGEGPSTLEFGSFVGLFWVD